MANSRNDRTQTVAVFLVCFLLTNIGMAVCWGGRVEDVVYHCFDGGFGYFTPGSWVHGDWVHVDDIEERVNADIMLVGWTIGRLWRLWLLMFGATVVVSAGLTYLVRRGEARDTV